ncbi:MAG: hypothetical protein JNK15_20675 [Planctomycetes bacterium]|nr:hypothetical protein [Planctomycetota bacterium]
MKILLLVALAAPLLALWPSFQDPAAKDWSKDVERACTSQRYGMRLSVGRAVAKAGAASIPAVRAWASKNGLDKVPSSLVDAFADDAPDEPAVLDLLREWAQLQDFYWRASALRGLALRAPRLTGDTQKGIGELFGRFRDDPAWLMRVHARFGLYLLGDVTTTALPEADPRARALLPSLLLGAGKVPPLQPLVDALGDDRTFQGDPWAQRVAGAAHTALRTWLGDALPQPPSGQFANGEEALAALLPALRTKSGQDLKAPPKRTDPATPFVGGVEMLSCKHGDVHLQWTAEGVVHFGIDAVTSVRLTAPKWDAVSQERTKLALGEGLGVVICDSLRLRWTQPDLHSKVAPASLPAPAAEWLKTLAQAIEEAGEPRLAAALRAGLEQFVAR